MGTIATAVQKCSHLKLLVHVKGFWGEALLPALPSLPMSPSEARDQVQWALSMTQFHQFCMDERSRCSSSNTDIHESYTDADVRAEGVPGIIKREPNDRKNKDGWNCYSSIHTTAEKYTACKSSAREDKSPSTCLKLVLRIVVQKRPILEEGSINNVYTLRELILGVLGYLTALDWRRQFLIKEWYVDDEPATYMQEKELTEHSAQITKPHNHRGWGSSGLTPNSVPLLEKKKRFGCIAGFLISYFQRKMSCSLGSSWLKWLLNKWVSILLNQQGDVHECCSARAQVNSEQQILFWKNVVFL